MINFAGDTTLYTKIDPSLDRTNLINEELTQVQLRINASRLNVEKNNFMILTNRANEENCYITLNGNNLSRSTSHKFLSVMIDETLKFDVHIS